METANRRYDGFRKKYMSSRYECIMIIYTTDLHPISTQPIYSIRVNTEEKIGSPNLNNLNTACVHAYVYVQLNVRPGPKSI